MADDIDEEDTLDEDDTPNEEMIASNAYAGTLASNKLEAERRRSKRQIQVTNAALWTTYLLTISFVIFAIKSAFFETPVHVPTLADLQAIISTVALVLTVLFGFAAVLIGSIKNKYAQAKSGRLFLIAFIMFACMAAAALSHQSR